jgi:ATP-dependent NAD(P)H-hydrate dehydratase
LIIYHTNYKHKTDLCPNNPQSHIICEPGAGAVIKTYSPNLMVHPYMRQSTHLSSSESAAGIADKVIAMLSRLHVLVIGPGLGRDSCMQETCARILVAARDKGMPVVLDADGLLLVQERGDELVKGWSDCVLTPNVVEFGRLCKARNITLASDAAGKKGEMQRKVEELARSLGGVTVIAKGAEDYISNGQTTLVSDGPGGLKRSGGQGDTLTGSLATLLAWRSAYHDGLWKTEGGISKEDSLALVGFAGSAITRECSRLAFKERGRSLQAADLTERVHEAFLSLVGEPTDMGKL